MKMKGKALFCALAIAAGMLSGCSGGNGQPSSQAPASSAAAPAASSEAASSAPADGEEVTLRINWWGGQERADITQEVINMYKQAHPNVTINAEFTSFDGYWEKMSAMSAARNLPDILQHDMRYLKQYVDKNLILDMTPYMNNGFDTADIPEVMLGGGTFDGKLYAVALGTNVWCVMYDPALFEKAGIPEPTNDWTWEDYEQICKSFKEKLDIYGDGEYAGSGYNGILYNLRQYGQSLYSEDGSQLGYTDDSIIEKVYALDKELYSAGAVAPPSVRIEIQETESEFLVTERAAMASQQWSNGFVTMCNAANRPIKMVLPPKAGDQTQWGGYIKPAQFFAIAADTQAPDTAVDFVNYFINDIDANLVLRGERGVPINSKVSAALAEQLSDNDRMVFEFVADAANYSSDLPPANPTIHGEVENLMSSISFQVEEGSLDPADAPAFFRSEVGQLYKNKQ